MAWAHCGDALVIADVDTGEIIDANPEAERLLGRSRGELVHLRQYDLHPKDQHAAARVDFAQGCAGEGRFSDLDIIRPDGSRIPVEIKSSGRCVFRGRNVVFGSFRDITERRASESAIERLNWAYSAIMRGNAAAMRADSEPALMQATCEAMTLGNTYILAWIGVPNDDPEQTNSVAAFSGTVTQYLDGIRISWADNTWGQGPTGRAIRQKTTQINNDAWTNPSFLPWSERAIKAGIHASIAVPLLDEDLVFGVLTVYSSRPNAFAESEVVLFEELAKNLVFAIQARRERIARENAAQEISRQAEQLRNALQQTIAIENALRIARDTAEAASLAKSRFLATMSHELRTPLNAILGFSEILENTSTARLDAETRTEYAGYIHRAGCHLLNIVNDILNMTRIEAGQALLKVVRLSVGTVFETVAHIVGERAAEKGLTLSRRVSECCPDLWADQHSITQILLNLLLNAIQHTPAGGRINMGAQAADDGIVLSIADTGTGIPTDQIDRMLEPFEQIGGFYTRGRGGIGLGLPLAQGLVRLHGGRLSIDSAVGAGTTVSVYFPGASPISAS